MPNAVSIRWKDGYDNRSLVLEKNIRTKPSRWEIVLKGNQGKKIHRKKVNSLPKDAGRLVGIIAWNSISKKKLIALFLKKALESRSKWPIEVELSELEDYSENLEYLIKLQ